MRKAKTDWEGECRSSVVDGRYEYYSVLIGGIKVYFSCQIKVMPSTDTTALHTVSKKS